MTKSQWAFMVSVSLLAGLLLVSGCGPASKVPGELQAPPAAVSAIRQAFPKASIEKVKPEEEDGVKVYEAKLLDNGKEMEIKVTGEGAILEIETDVAPGDLPKAVSDAVAKAAPGAKIKKARKEETLADVKRGKLAKAELKYEVEVAQNGKEGELEVAPDGKIVEELQWKGEEKEENDEKGKESARHESLRTGWRDSFPVNKADLTDIGTNPYFILQPGHRLCLEHGKAALTITVLDETKVVDGVKTRIVEERETEDGQLEEVSRNYFAIDAKTKDVYYFGEEVDIYKNGKVVRHEGCWASGVNGARFGLIMPGNLKVGDRFYQEMAPKVAMDRCEVVSLAEETKTPAGTFKGVVRLRDSSALEGGGEIKLYAPGVGLIRDGEFVLVKIENAK